MYALAFISENNKIGIDIELCKNFEKVNGAVDEFFVSDVYTNLNMLSEGLRWTMHEAIGKLEKIGIFRELPILDVRVCNEIENNFRYFCALNVRYKNMKYMDIKEVYCLGLQTKDVCVMLAIEKL
ncbi:hypothetical protein C8E03_10211 [Lachnotalea glycerini]|uniref:Uncharacterized protein n=1 Tax=Lachnotalea glycerini TaxID=1763509 RepID=A0A318EP50_9FIRM|nr:hypothetical protein [Lachnotalea glycerini]PXV93245.1 hypothetical protein C8E03_10211 [Lachnotalea glycerini]